MIIAVLALIAITGCKKKEISSSDQLAAEQLTEWRLKTKAYNDSLQDCHDQQLNCDSLFTSHLDSMYHVCDSLFTVYHDMYSHNYVFDDHHHDNHGGMHHNGNNGNGGGHDHSNHPNGHHQSDHDMMDSIHVAHKPLHP